jgi:flagella basal body P-ring formation protein FlgA
MIEEQRENVRVLRTRLHNLAREHGELKTRVAEYASRRYLSPGEELEMKALQRLKLMKKDSIVVVERALATLESQVA